MASQFDYYVQDRELVIANKSNNTIVWKGRLKELDVVAAIPIPRTQDCVVLLDWLQAESRSARNLLRVNATGEIVWESGRPSKILYGIERSDTEIYVKVEIKENNILGTSASGFDDYLDVQNGEILESVFTK